MQPRLAGTCAVVMGVMFILLAPFAWAATSDLTVSVTASPNPIAMGDVLTYSIQVRNQGASAVTNVVLTDALPAGVTFSSVTPGQGTCTGAVTVTCALGTLPAGETVTVTLGVIPSATGVVGNTVSVSSDQPTPNVAGGVARIWTSVLPSHQQSLTVTTTGSGTGTVSSMPVGITCQPSCSASFPAGTLVTLTATPLSNSVFTGWSGACTGTAASCVAMVTTGQSVTATFSGPPQQWVVGVATDGNGIGSVSSSPFGISCQTSCSASFPAGTLVTLTATPQAGSVFTGWSGVCAGNGACVAVVTESIWIRATFSQSSSGPMVTPGALIPALPSFPPTR